MKKSNTPVLPNTPVLRCKNCEEMERKLVEAQEESATRQMKFEAAVRTAQELKKKVGEGDNRSDVACMGEWQAKKTMEQVPKGKRTVEELKRDLGAAQEKIRIQEEMIAKLTKFSQFGRKALKKHCDDVTKKGENLDKALKGLDDELADI